MKQLILFLIIICALFSNNYAQETHTFGPRKENFTRTWIKQNSGTPYGYSDVEHFVGSVNSGGSLYNYRNINFWQWTYDEIPTEAEVTSVTITFQAYKGYNHNFIIDIHNIPYPVNQQVNFYNSMDSNNLIYEEQFTPDQNQMIFFNRTFSPGDDVFDAVTDAVQSGNYFFTLGIKEAGSSIVPNWRISELGVNKYYSNRPSINLTINYTTPNQFFTFKNLIGTSNNYGKLVLNENTSSLLNSDTTIFVPWQADNYIRTNELPFIYNWNQTGTVRKAKYWDILGSNYDYNLSHQFNSYANTVHIMGNAFDFTVPVSIDNNFESFGNGGKMNFKDPWFYYNTENTHWYQSNEFKDYTTPYVFANNLASSYGGVFLDQTPDPNDPNKPYYSVKADATQDITLTQTGRTHKFYFQNWSGSGAGFQNANALETGVVFNSANAVVNANYKGHLFSDASLAFAGNGQRKLIKDASGYYHAVYHTSTGIWYTRSTTTDFGGEWTPDKLVCPFGANPSIDIYGQNVKIVFEADDETSTYIFLAEFNYSQQWDQSTVTRTIIDDNCLASLYSTIYPVVAATQTEVFVLYKKNNTTGLQYKRKYWDGRQWINVPTATLLNTDGTSCKPSLASWYTNDVIHIAWQQGDTQIRYLYSYRQSFNRNFASYNIISIGSGNEKNINPSISLHTGQSFPIVSWTGLYINTTEKTVAKENSQTIYMRRVTARTKAADWGSFYQAGSDVNYSNSSSTNSGTAESVISWSQSNGSVSKWVKRVNGTYLGIYNLTYAGIIPHMSGGTSLANIKTLTFKNNTSPVFYAETDNTDFSQNPLKKTDAVYDLTYGRKGVLFKDSLEFVYNVGDILVNDDVVKFIPISDTLQFTTLDDLNTTLRTEAFMLDENSRLLFSDFYRVINPEYASEVLNGSDYVKFAVELINAADGTVTGAFDPVEYSVNSLYAQGTKDYSINCSGIAAGDYYMRLKIESNTSLSYAMSNEFNDAENLNKKHYTERELFNVGDITTYDLSQNYPNPFNPSTTIRYAIPKDGMVTLKIYDILGSEVKTLVNNYQAKGRYEVTFDASRLASGLYIYEISSGDYKASKKMTLIK